MERHIKVDTIGLDDLPNGFINILKSSVERLASLKRVKDELKDQEKAINAEIERWTGVAAGEMLRLGIRDFHLQDGTMAKLRPVLYVNKKGGVESTVIVDVIKALGIDDLITYSPPRLKAYVDEGCKDLNGADPINALPEPLREYFSVYETFAVSITAKKEVK